MLSSVFVYRWLMCSGSSNRQRSWGAEGEALYAWEGAQWHAAASKARAAAGTKASTAANGAPALFWLRRGRLPSKHQHTDVSAEQSWRQTSCCCCCTECRPQCATKTGMSRSHPLAQPIRSIAEPCWHYMTRSQPQNCAHQEHICCNTSDVLACIATTCHCRSSVWVHAIHLLL